MKHAGQIYDVKEVAASAFSGCTNLKSVTLNKIEVIRQKAFAGCENLQILLLSDCLCSINEYAFAWCGIETLKLPSTTANIGQYAFVGCIHLKHVVCEAQTPPYIDDKTFDSETLKKGILLVHASDLVHYQQAEGWRKFATIQTIEDELARKKAYENNEEDDDDEEENKDIIFTESFIYRITDEKEVCVEQCNPETTGTLEIPSSIEKDGKKYAVTSISKGALDECTKVKEIKLPYSLEDITFGTFAHCNSLTHIHVDPRNQFFNEIDGVLTDKYKNILICYPKARTATSYRVPASVIGIATACFIDCVKLEEVTLYDNLRYFGIQAFYNCQNLRSISLPIATSEINGGAFYLCNKLESIYTLSEDPATVNDAFDDDTLKRATLYVVRDSLQTFKSHEEWSRFSKIRPINDICPEGTNFMFRANSERTATLISASSNPTGAISIPDTIQANGNTYKVTRIGRESLEDCEDITSVQLPDSIESIGYHAFSGCTSIKKLELPQQLRVIENEAFSHCVNLTTLSIPKLVEAIGDGIVNGSIKLQALEVAEENAQFLSKEGILYDRRGALVSYPAAKKDKTVNIGASVDAMNSTTFIDATNLTDFEVSANNPVYASIDGVLVSRDQTTLIAYPRGRKEKKYNIYGSIKNISQWAFGGCALTHITLPAGLIHLEPGAFYNCDKLQSISLPEGLTTISNRCFLACRSLKNIVFPKSIEKIEMGAFSNCLELSSIELPEKVTSIENGTFANCTSLVNIQLPSELESIGNYAFANCPQISRIVFPASLNSIGHKAFNGTFAELGLLNSLLNNENEMTIVLLGETPPVISEDTFDEYTLHKTTLQVPKNAVQTYKRTAGWSAFKNIVGWEEHRKGKKEKEVKFVEKMFTYKVVNDDEVELCKLNNEYISNICIPESVEHNGKQYTITRIGESAFEDSLVTNLDIEAPLEKIGKYAFANSSLTNIFLPNTLQEIEIGAFGGCEYLKQINLPNSLKELGIEAFAECHSLEAIAIPQGIDKLNYHTFYHCKSLQAVSIGDGVECIEEGVFEKCFNLTSIAFGNKLEDIGKSAFENCTSLTHLCMPESMAMVGDHAFYQCNLLNKIYLPAGMKFIGSEVFKKCQHLHKVTIGRGGEAYASKDGVLYNSDFTELIFCPPMISGTLELPKTVKHLADSAFEDSNVSTLVLGDKLTTIGKRCFSNSQLTTLILPAKLKSIGEQAFLSCRKLKSITLPEKITHLKEDLFRNCIKLEEVVLPPMMKVIETGAFKGCNKLQSITIDGDNCVIKEKSFENCKLLEKVETSGIKSIDKNAFYNCPLLK